MGVSLTQVVAMNEDKIMAAKWLSENVDTVLEDLNAIHNIHMDMALMHGLLTGKDDLVRAPERITKVIELLEDWA